MKERQILAFFLLTPRSAVGLQIWLINLNLLHNSHFFIFENAIQFHFRQIAKSFILGRDTLSIAKSAQMIPMMVYRIPSFYYELFHNLVYLVGPTGFEPAMVIAHVRLKVWYLRPTRYTNPNHYTPLRGMVK